VKLGDATGLDAFFIAGFGLTNQKIGDTFLKIESIRNRENAIRDAQKEYNRQMSNFRNATDLEQKKVYLTNARAIMEISDLLPKEKSRWIYNAVKDVDVVEKISRDFVTKSPIFQRDARMKQMLAEQAEESKNATER
jgi:Holliday junction resolvase RusA-like endonuclease